MTAAPEVVRPFVRLLDLVVPSGGIAIVITAAPDIYPVYVDESYGPDSPVLCVAGYIFAPDKAKEMSRKWADVLSRWALPYFHMSACNGGHDEFAHLDQIECDKVAREVIALTREYAEYGFCVAIAEDAYHQIFPPEMRAETGSAYTYALRNCLTMTRRWADDTKFHGRFAFFFEDGHKYANEAREIIGSYRKSPSADHFRYHSSTFIDKEDAEPLQAADIFAWQAYTSYKRQFAGKEPRKDLIALLRPQDKLVEFTVPRLQEAREHLEKQYFSRKTGTSYSSGNGSSGAMPN